MIKSNPIHTRWVTHGMENNNTKVLHYCEGPEPHDRLPSLGI